MICELCFHHCDLCEGQAGFCRARACRDGAIVPLNYGKVTSAALDPIEKKPLPPYGNIGVAYTYNEPLIGYEYARDCAALVHEKGMVNVLVTNGTIEEALWRELLPLIDAANIFLRFVCLTGGTSEHNKKGRNAPSFPLNVCKRPTSGRFFVVYRGTPSSAQCAHWGGGLYFAEGEKWAANKSSGG